MTSKKKVLIISYYWPPAGGISVLRALKISKYLLDYGWNPVVLTIDNPQYPIVDEANFKHVPEGVKVIKAGGFQPFDLYKKITKRKKSDTLANVLNANSEKTGLLHKISIWLRANFFIPDARSSWIHPAITKADKYIRENKVDAIFSDGPPHTNTVIAYKLSEKHNIPWLMDWQDPWTEVDYYKMFPIGKFADRKHKELEQKCFQQASAMTIVSPSWKEDAINLGAKNVDVVYWGYDADDFKDVEKEPTEKFVISHVGLLGDDRVSKALFEALGELVKENKDFADKLQVVFYGTTTRLVDELLKDNDLLSRSIIKSQVPRREALKIVVNSDINLLLLNVADNAKGRIPGKLFEYIHANNTILNIGPTDSDVNTIIKDIGNIGETFEYSDTKGIKNFTKNVYDKKCLGDNNRLINDRDLEKYSIKSQVFKIAEILNFISLKG